jgi:drug/metabolite transporter (DMT)-like permease
LGAALMFGAVLFLGESVVPIQLAGGAVVLAGVWLAT